MVPTYYFLFGFLRLFAVLFVCMVGLGYFLMTDNGSVKILFVQAFCLSVFSSFVLVGIYIGGRMKEYYDYDPIKTKVEKQKCHAAIKAAKLVNSDVSIRCYKNGPPNFRGGYDPLFNEILIYNVSESSVYRLTYVALHERYHYKKYKEGVTSLKKQYPKIFTKSKNANLVEKKNEYRANVFAHRYVDKACQHAKHCTVPKPARKKSNINKTDTSNQQ